MTPELSINSACRVAVFDLPQGSVLFAVVFFAVGSVLLKLRLA
jgi:hypothetical protein